MVKVVVIRRKEKRDASLPFDLTEYVLTIEQQHFYQRKHHHHKADKNHSRE